MNSLKMICYKKFFIFNIYMGELSLDFLKCWWQGEKSTAKREYGGFTKRWFQHQWDVIGIKNKKIQKDRKAMFQRGIRLVQKNTGTGA